MSQAELAKPDPAFSESRLATSDERPSPEGTQKALGVRSWEGMSACALSWKIGGPRNMQGCRYTARWLREGWGGSLAAVAYAHAKCTPPDIPDLGYQSAFRDPDGQAM